jgi:hypothetical protein
MHTFDTFQTTLNDITSNSTHLVQNIGTQIVPSNYLAMMLSKRLGINLDLETSPKALNAFHQVITSAQNSGLINIYDLGELQLLLEVIDSLLVDYSDASPIQRQQFFQPQILLNRLLSDPHWSDDNKRQIQIWLPLIQSLAQIILPHVMLPSSTKQVGGHLYNVSQGVIFLTKNNETLQDRLAPRYPLN